MRITVLSPHRDDAAFSVGLVIGTMLNAGHAVEVVNCFTRSQYAPFGGFDRISERRREPQITSVRRLEDLRWISQYGQRISLIDLALLDAPQRLSCSLDDVCTIPIQPKDYAIDSIRHSISVLATQAILLPLGIGGHVDHLTTRFAIEKEWTNDKPVAFYEDLPYAARPGAADGINDLVDSLNRDLRSTFVCPANDTRAVERKRNFAQSYASQIDSITVDEIAKFCGRYGGRERLWVNKAWCKTGLGDGS